MDSSYYKEYYNIERQHWWFKARSAILEAYIRNHISRGKKLRILNVGVATGASSEMLMRFGQVISLEYEQDCIDFIRDKVSIEIIQGSILRLPFEGKNFDLVCAFDVIEHVEDDRLAVAELKRVCRDEGSVLVTVPALMSLWGEHDKINHHYRRYSRKLLISVFEGEGSIIYSTYFNFFLFPFIYLTRKLANVSQKKKREIKSDFAKYNPGIISKLLYGVFISESKLLIQNKQLPIGVSLLLHWKKHNNL